MPEILSTEQQMNNVQETSNDEIHQLVIYQSDYWKMAAECAPAC